MTSRIRAYHPESHDTIEKATQALIEANGTYNKAANRCRVGTSQLSDYANEHNTSKYMPVDVVLQLELAARKRPMTEHLAAQHHCVLVQLPEYPDSNDLSQVVTNFIERNGAFGKEFGEAIAVGSAAVSDGILTEDELVRWIKEIDDALSVGAEVRQLLKARLTRVREEKL